MVMIDKIISCFLYGKYKMMTSDPKRAFETMNFYMGIQTRHQHMLGISWFMREMLRQNIFSHELQTLARKIVYGYKWRKEDTLCLVST